MEYPNVNNVYVVCWRRPAGTDGRTVAIEEFATPADAAHWRDALRAVSVPAEIVTLHPRPPGECA